MSTITSFLVAALRGVASTSAAGPGSEFGRSCAAMRFTSTVAWLAFSACATTATHWPKDTVEGASVTKDPPVRSSSMINATSEEEQEQLRLTVEALDAALRIANKPEVINGEVQPDAVLRQQARDAASKVQVVLEYPVAAPLEDDLLEVLNVAGSQGVGYNTQPGLNGVERLQQIRAKLERILALPALAAYTVDFTIRSVPRTDAEFSLVQRNQVVASHTGRGDQKLVRVVRAHYKLTISDGNNRCECELNLYDHPPTEVICNLSVGGECTRH